MASEEQATPAVNRYTGKGPIPLSANYRQEGRPFSLGDCGLLAQLFGQFGFITSTGRSHSRSKICNSCNDGGQHSPYTTHDSSAPFLKFGSIIIMATAIRVTTAIANAGVDMPFSKNIIMMEDIANVMARAIFLFLRYVSSERG